MAGSADLLGDTLCDIGFLRANGVLQRTDKGQVMRFKAKIKKL